MRVVVDDGYRNGRRLFRQRRRRSPLHDPRPRPFHDGKVPRPLAIRGIACIQGIYNVAGTATSDKALLLIDWRS